MGARKIEMSELILKTFEKEEGVSSPKKELELMKTWVKHHQRTVEIKLDEVSKLKEENELLKKELEILKRGKEELKKYEEYLCGWKIQKIRDFCNKTTNLLSDIGEVEIKGHLVDSLVLIHSQRKRDIAKISKLIKENELIKSDLSFLTQPIGEGISLDDLEECFSMLRKKWNLDSLATTSVQANKEGGL